MSAMLYSIRTGEQIVPVLYCDLDGTIRWGKDQLGRFVTSAADVKVFPEVPDLLEAYKDLGWRIIAVSNQGGIALGHMDMPTCAAAMLETQRQCRNRFDKIAWCSHHPAADEPEMAVCWCRKPKAGLVIEAALDLSHTTHEIYPPHLGLLVGDQPEDEGCAEAAGLQFLDAAEWRSGIHLDLMVAQQRSAE